MSYESRRVVDANYDQSDRSVVTYQRRQAYFGVPVQYASSVVINLRKLQTELNSQHQHEKEALDELNKRFHLFVDRIQYLQSQNAKYLSAIGEHRRKISGIGTFDARSEEYYQAQQLDFSKLQSAKIDYESDLEFFQLQIGFYQQSSESDQPWTSKRLATLEQELKQVTSALAAVRKSHAELEREIQTLYVARENAFKQYLALAQDWCNVKKQRKRSLLSIEVLKNYVAFYQSLRSHSVRGVEVVAQQTDDSAQYWALELEKIKKKIRRDFEAYYSAIHREVDNYYKSRMVEVETEITRSFQHEESDVEEIVVIERKLKIEYEEVHKVLLIQKNSLEKLSITYSSLEAEYKSLQLQQEERFETQAVDLQSIQENIMIMISDVEELRRNKSHLETEIIIYRNLLDLHEADDRVVVAHRPQTSGNGLLEKFNSKKQRKGSIGIKECAPNGAFIVLSNHSTSKTIDISKWTLERQVDSASKIRFRLPDGTRLEPESVLRIYARQRDGSAGSSPTRHGSSSSLDRDLVNNELVSWGTGSTSETALLNRDGEREASYSQTLAYKKE